MAADHGHAPAPATGTFNTKGLGGAGMLVGIVGFLALGAGFATLGDKALKTILQSYAFGWSFLMATILGCYGLMLLHNLVRGSWGLSILRYLEAGGGVGALTFGAITFLPIALNLGTLYKWVNPDPTDALVMHKVLPMAPGLPGWLTQEFFLARTALYFAIWIAYAYFLRKYSLLEDETKDFKYRKKKHALGAHGVLVFVLTITLASTDWFMSLDPHWFSSIFGPWYMIGGALFALSIGTAIVCANAKKTPYNEIVSPNLTKDLGNLCFAFCMLWIYFTLSQYLIIWSGNLPEFIVYYKVRQAGWLPWVGAANVLIGWLLPWMLLLIPNMKAKPERLLFVVAILLFARPIDLFWNMVPLLGRTYLVWTDVAAIVAMLGFWFWVVGSVMSKVAVLPSHDTRLQEALHHSHA